MSKTLLMPSYSSNSAHFLIPHISSFVPMPHLLTHKTSSIPQKYTDSNSSACLSEMWKLKKSLFPKKPSTLPTAKINYQRKLVSEPNELIKLIGEEYGKTWLRKRPTHPLNIEGKKIRKM